MTFEVKQRVWYAGSLGHFTGTVVELRDPAVIVHAEGLGLVACGESELEPLDEHDEPAQVEQPPVEPEPQEPPVD